MIRSNNTATATARLTRTSRVVTAARRVCMALLILTSLSACRGPKVINADQTLMRLPAGRTFRAPVDGWYMSDALYQRYRRAVSDRIFEETRESKQ